MSKRKQVDKELYIPGLVMVGLTQVMRHCTYSFELDSQIIANGVLCFVLRRAKTSQHSASHYPSLEEEHLHT